MVHRKRAPARNAVRSRVARARAGPARRPRMARGGNCGRAAVSVMAGWGFARRTRGGPAARGPNLSAAGIGRAAAPRQDVFRCARQHLRRDRDEKRHQLDRYLAPQVIDGLLGARPDALEHKRRATITVFFSDIIRFSDLADRLDPDALSVVMNEYLAEMAEVAFAFGGTVDKFIGDSLMVLFGAPIEENVEKQARQCVAMACQMHRRTATLNRRWCEAGLVKEGLAVRMGIHTGEANVWIPIRTARSEAHTS